MFAFKDLFFYLNQNLILYHTHSARKHQNTQNSNHNQAILINEALLKTNFHQDILKSADVYIDNKQILK